MGDAQRSCSKALTMLEMIISLAIIAVIFAVVLPQFKNIQNSWASKRATAEAIQNGRILVSYLNRNLSKAIQITAVSDPADTTGYIEFEGNDSVTYRYEIGADNIVEFGPVGNLSDLAGPVSQLQFTCYDAQDLDTPITTVGDIRCVRVEATLTNAGPGQDQTFTASAYLRSSYDSNLPPVYVEPDSPLEFNVVLGQNPNLAQIDNTHYLCAYAGPGEDGWSVVVTVNTTDWTVNRETPFEYDTYKGDQTALAKIDDEHYLCTYNGNNDDGFAVILKVNETDWTVSRGAPLEFAPTGGKFPALTEVDATHFLCVYQGAGNRGYAVVFEVDTASDTVSVVSTFEFETKSCNTPAISGIEDTRYLCVYEGPQNDGWAVVLEVNAGTYEIQKASEFEYDSTNGQTPALIQIDLRHFLCAYSGWNDNGYAVVLIVSILNNISKGPVLNYDLSKAITPDLAQLTGNSYVCVYEGPSVDAWTNVFTVDTDDWTITSGLQAEFDPIGGKTPTIARIYEPTGNRSLVVYQGANNDGWAAILNTRSLRP